MIGMPVLDRLTSNEVQIPYFRWLASMVLRVHRPMIVAVTGSVGKTTTRDAIATVLTHPSVRQQVGAVRRARKNFNSRRGLPLAILGEDSQGGSPRARTLWLLAVTFRAFKSLVSTRFPKILVLEVGTNHPGHVRMAVGLARPDIAILTTIAPAHMEAFGSLEGIFQEKMEIVRAVRDGGLVITGVDGALRKRVRDEAPAVVQLVEGEGVARACNIARAVARHIGVPEKQIESALKEFRPPKRRLNHIEVNSLTIIDDTYNANPASMELALRRLADAAAAGRNRRMAILGDMKEMGNDAERYHREVGAYARNRADLVIAVGDLAKTYGADHWFATTEDCAKEVRKIVLAGDIVLVKGSHSMRMDAIVDVLRINRSACQAGSR